MKNSPDCGGDCCPPILSLFKIFLDLPNFMKLFKHLCKINAGLYAKLFFSNSCKENLGETPW